MLVAGARIRPGETVLVEAAAGGVGSLLVQLAAGAGARVIAAAGGQRKLALARELGAAVAVDYAEPDWTAGLEGVDVVFDGVGGEIGCAAFELLRPGGRFCPFGMASGAFAEVPERDGVTLVRRGRPAPADMLVHTRSTLVEAAAGRLRPVIGQTFPLERAAEAHAAIEARETIGKTLLIVR
jgi:NADPH2:quinone reductase